MKTCSKCGVEYPETTEYFYAKKTGFRSRCKKCLSAQERKYVADNFAKIKERQRQYYIANKNRIDDHNKSYNKENREAVLLYQKQHYQLNKATIAIRHAEYRNLRKRWYAEYCKNYQQINKESIARYHKKNYEERREHYATWGREYALNHKSEFAIKRQKRRTLLSGLPATLTASEWQAIKDSFNNKCCYCGQEKALVQEHFIPLVKGGEYTANNILPSCQRCNNSKTSKDFFAWYKVQDYYSKTRERKILKFLNYDNRIQQLSIPAGVLFNSERRWHHEKAQRGRLYCRRHG